MTTPTKSADTEWGRAWRKWILWTFAVLALLLMLEHRAHARGWGLHALLGQCVGLLYLVVRIERQRVFASTEHPHVTRPLRGIVTKL